MAVKKLVVIGMGYAGIPVAALFADVPGFEVLGIQRNSRRSGWKIECLNAGRSPFPETEPNIFELIHRVVVEKKTFRVTDDFNDIKDADYVLVDVQTPIEPISHFPRYDSLKEVCGCIANSLRKGALVCIESTVAPGTTRNIVKPILEKTSDMKAGLDFHLCFSYERVMVGRLLHNIRQYPRIVGGLTPKCAQIGVDLYKNVVEAEVTSTDSLTAEAAKTIENVYRDVNIAFANEAALMCESLGVNVYKVRELVNNLPNDPSNPASNPVRNMHIPGAGVGGHCLPKDAWLLKYGVDSYGDFPVKAQVITAAREINNHMPVHLARLALSALKECGTKLNEARVTILGYAYIENSDDARNTPAEPLIEELKSKGIQNVLVHDPFVRKGKEHTIVKDLDQAFSQSDCAIFVTGHSVYRCIDLKKTLKLMRLPLVVDGRNIFNGTKMKNLGFTYRAMGKPQEKSYKLQRTLN